MDIAAPPMLCGQLRRETLPAFLEFLAATQFTGTINLEGPNERQGLLVLERGQLMHAACDAPDADLIGLEALIHVLAWEALHCEVLERLPPGPPRSIEMRIERALLEAAKFEDEHNQFARLSPHAKLRPKDNVQAYQSLSLEEWTVYQKAKMLRRSQGAVTVGELQQRLAPLEVARFLKRLMQLDLLEIEGIRDTNVRPALEVHRALRRIVPVRQGNPLPGDDIWPLRPVQQAIVALCDGTRTAEDIRRVLRLSPGQLRMHLAALRQAGRVVQDDLDNDGFSRFGMGSPPNLNG